MAIEIKPPRSIQEYLNTTRFRTAFLGGSIEMGKAEPWQDRVVDAFYDRPDVVFFNPRRDAWDSTWEQSINNPVFKVQVVWELSGLEECDVAFFYLQPGTKSPISLLEFGLHKDKAIVCCPDGYWRKGNVDITCERYGAPVFDDLDKAIKALRAAL